MKPIEETPTRPVNYALISGVYGAGLSAVAAQARGTGVVPRGTDLLPLGIATFTFTRVLTEQKVEEWLRHPFVEESSDGRRPRGHGMRYAVGELLSCTRCTGAWVGLALVAVHVASPTTGRVAAAVGTVGAVNDIALAGFAWLTARANAADEESSSVRAEDTPPGDGGTDGAPASDARPAEPAADAPQPGESPAGALGHA